MLSDVTKGPSRWLEEMRAYFEPVRLMGYADVKLEDFLADTVAYEESMRP